MLINSYDMRITTLEREEKRLLPLALRKTRVRSCPSKSPVGQGAGGGDRLDGRPVGHPYQIHSSYGGVESVD
jgi:hypothetical protein